MTYIGKTPTSVPLTSSDITDGIITKAKLADTYFEYVNSDITALALREATNEASAAFNLPNQFIETFTDDTNLGTQTDGDRVSGCWYSIEPAVGVNSNTKILLHMDDTSLIDSSGTSTSTTLSGDLARSGTESKFGSYSALSDGTGDYLTFSNVPVLGSSLWGLDFWWHPTAVTGSSNQAFFAGTTDGQWFGFRFDEAIQKFKLEVGTSGGGWMSPGSHTGTKTSWSTDTWYHIAISRVDDTTIKWWVDGVLDATKSIASGSFSCSSDPILSRWGGGGDWPFVGYVDEYRMQIGESPQMTSTDPLYISTGTGFTPPTSAYSGSSINATATLIQSANTVASAKTKVGGTMLYKDNAGTATLGTDLKIYFTCDNSNWTEADSYNAFTPAYSTGVKQVRLGETTCTSGTDVRYKAVWANQSSGSKETQLHGIGVNY